MSTAYRGKRRAAGEGSKHAAEALQRAQSGQSWANFPAIVEGFTAKGIPAGEIIPRVNVLTYDAWRAAGRQVRKGEHGVKVCTFIPTGREREERGADGSVVRRSVNRPWTTTVFHISQTDPIGARRAAPAAVPAVSASAPAVVSASVPAVSNEAAPSVAPLAAVAPLSAQPAPTPRAELSADRPIIPVAELERDAKAGRQISLYELSRSIEAERQQKRRAAAAPAVGPVSGSAADYQGVIPF